MWANTQIIDFLFEHDKGKSSEQLSAGLDRGEAYGTVMCAKRTQLTLGSK